MTEVGVDWTSDVIILMFTWRLYKIKAIYLEAKKAVRRNQVVNSKLTVFPLHLAEHVNHVDSLDL